MNETNLKKLSRVIVWSFVVVAALMSIGCGSDRVTAEGMVTVDGNPANGGQLLLSQTEGEKHRAFGYVGDDGRFVLGTEEGEGVLPGNYSIAYRVEIDSAKQASMPASVRQQMTGDTFTLSYTSPPDVLLSVPEGGSSELEISIDSRRGWTRGLSD